MINVSTHEPAQLHSNGEADTTDNSGSTMLESRDWQGKMQLMNSLSEGSTFCLISGHIVASGIVCLVISLETGRVKINWTLISYFLKVVLLSFSFSFSAL